VQIQNGIVAEYAFRDIAKPLGIAEFKHTEKLPEQLKGTLPTIEEIEAELGARESRQRVIGVGFRCFAR